MLELTHSMTPSDYKYQQTVTERDNSRRQFGLVSAILRQLGSEDDPNALEKLGAELLELEFHTRKFGVQIEGSKSLMPWQEWIEYWAVDR